MSTSSKYIVNSFVYAVIFIALPMILGMYLLLTWAHDFFLFLGTGFTSHYILVCAGLVAGIILFYTRLRWLVIMILLFILFQAILSLTGHMISAGEIDYFFQLHNITIKAVLFLAGTAVSYSLLNSRLSAIVMSSLLIALTLYLLTRSDTLSREWSFPQILLFFVSTASFIIYTIYIQRRHHHIYTQSGPLSHFKTYGHSVLFIVFLLLVSGIHVFLFRQQIDETWSKMTKEYDPGGSESLEQRGEDGVKLNDKSRLSGSNSRSNELLMVAYIDNFFEGTDVPNPLYLTAFYYTHFDSATETFKRVDDMPDRDLFSPDPTSVPLYFTETDSSVLSLTRGNRLMKTVEVEVYNKGLEPRQFFAPSTSFSVQPIAVDKNYQAEYKNAYKSRSLVSELNSAYFVYNTDHPDVLQFQKNRTDILKEIKSFDVMDRNIFDYYTRVPRLDYIEEIRRLALDITDPHPTPIEKIIAIRDYFQSKDEKGDPLFRYSDNPGIPDLPSASKLYHFLFQNRSGYCAYYAGATLLMLRSLGIPSRVNVGFLTHDRSTSNKGWYYFYANQLHAWVQVYFPGYGWIDFDTTIGNDDARESPQPDGTPPASPPAASLSMAGIVVSADTVSGELKISTKQIALNGNELRTDSLLQVAVSTEKARILLGHEVITSGAIRQNDTASVVVFNQAMVRDITVDNISESLIPAEIIVIKRYTPPVPENGDSPDQLKNPVLGRLAWILGGIAVIIIILLSLPGIILAVYLRKSRNLDIRSGFQKAFRALTFYLHQNEVVDIDSLVPSKYFSVVDDTFGTALKSFYRDYQKVKYSGDVSDVKDHNVRNIIHSVDAQHYRDRGHFYRLYNKVNFVRALKFLFK